MPSLLIPLGPLSLAKGESKILHWNNATPGDAVWYIQAVPQASSFTQTPIEQHVEAEITRVWRLLKRRSEDTSKEFPSSDIEHEIWFEIKNLSDKKIDVKIYASVTS
jgi:hypothetical protein